MSSAQPRGRLLALNAGSSSIKFGVFARSGEGLEQRAGGALDGIGSEAHFEAKGPHGEVLAGRTWSGAQPGYDELLATLLDWTEAHEGGALRAVGHRVVHGGVRFTGPALVDDAVLAELDALVPLAPLHQPHSLELIRRMRALHPAVPHVACFDTAFHASNSSGARRFGLPRKFEAEGLVRYGFHGLSYEFVAGELARRDPAAFAGKSIIAHLGNGASLCALVGGRSVATTMSFSVLDGLLMGTRCGSLDPAAVIYLQRTCGLSLDEVEHLLYEESGLLGVSGLSSDMRRLEAAGAGPAAEAVELFIYRLVREIGSMAAAAGGLGSLVFTAGIGEHAATVRARTCAALDWLGIELNGDANRAAQPGRISSDLSRASVWVIPTNEEATIARHTEPFAQPS